MKSFEVMFESYPQLVLNVFIMLNLQIYTRPLNLASAMISVSSILYGISDTITFNPKPSGLFGRSIQWGGVDLRLNGF